MRSSRKIRLKPVQSVQREAKFRSKKCRYIRSRLARETKMIKLPPKLLLVGNYAHMSVCVVVKPRILNALMGSVSHGTIKYEVSPVPC